MRIILSIIALTLFLGVSGCTNNQQTSTSATTSASISVYFTNPFIAPSHIQNSSAQDDELSQALIALMDSAEHRLDIAVYSFSLKALSSALERACQRNINIRLIVESETVKQDHPVHSLLCVSIRLDQNKDLMHEKFLVVDAETVWIGSHNWTCLDLYRDANNALLIRDKAVAAAFLSEFDEMFDGRFGRQKRDMNEEHFTLGAHSLELYFLPTDAARAALLQRINDARSSIQIAMYAFTHNLLRDALLEAQARGVRVQAVWDLQGMRLTGSDVATMLNRDVGVLDALPGLVHHKFAVIDQRILVTGSANWSRAGFEKNDEFLLILDNAPMAQKYLMHWQKLYDDAVRYDHGPLQPPRMHARVFDRTQAPNKTSVRVEWRPHLIKPVDAYELCRARSPQGPCEATFSDLAPGTDFFIDTSVDPRQAYYYRLRGRVGDRWSDYSNEYATNPSENCHE
jgi:phosphatidylserine/phosphatidylglycerophosphate/cardiolipin synthase-like enzyme